MSIAIDEQFIMPNLRSYNIYLRIENGNNKDRVLKIGEVLISDKTPPKKNTK